ncbi:MAG: hypothetical protein ACPG5P_05235 [Saprospiraceae bacterium]
MKRYLIFTLVFTLLFFACKPERNSERNTISKDSILGLWCNDFHCVSFEEEKCVFNYKAWNYITTDSSITLQGEESFEKIDFSLIRKNNRLIIEPKFSQGGATSMSRTKQLNEEEFKVLKYSQLSPFSDFNVMIQDNGKININISNHPLYEAGKYVGTISDSHFRMLKDLIHCLPLDLNDDLNSEIISDVVEWGLIIYDKENNKNSIYYNNKNLGSEGKFLSSFMDQLPFFIKDIKPFIGKISMTDITEYHKTQFQKNIELQKDSLQ